MPYRFSSKPKQAAVLEILLASHPTLLSRSELRREVGDRVQADDALAHFERLGLVHRLSGLLLDYAHDDGRRGGQSRRRRLRSGAGARSMTPGSQAGYTVMRAVQTLDLLARGPITARELAEALNVHARTARRILQRLEVDGYAAKPTNRGAFEPTAALRSLGQRLARSAPVADTPSRIAIR
jgi:hypothetical protein